MHLSPGHSRLSCATALTPARLARATRGDAVVEYGLLVGGITVGAIFSVLALGQTVPEAYDNPPDALPPHCEVSVEQFVELYGTGQLPPECMVDNPGNDMFVPHTPMDTSGTSMTLDPSDPRTEDDPQDPDDGSYPYKAPELVCEGFACQLLASTTSGPGTPTSGPTTGPTSGPPSTPTSSPPPGYCPPYSGWTWDPIRNRYILPGIVAGEPLFTFGGTPFSSVYTFDYPWENYLYVPYPVAQNWWGDYVGIRFWLYHTWTWTDRFEFDEIRAPGPGCPNLTYISSAPGTGSYAPYWDGGSLTSGPWLEGTNTADGLDMNTAGGPYDGVIGFDLDDGITDTPGDEIIIPGPGDESVDSEGGADIYVYRLGDGDDIYTPENATAGDDIVHFLGIARSEVAFSFSGYENRSLRLTMPDGQTLTLGDVFNSDPDRHLEELRFTDGSLTLDMIRTQMLNAGKISGLVSGTPLPERYIHFDGDGSYTIESVDNAGSTYNTLEFTGLTLSDVTFDRAGGTLFIDTPAGDRIRAEEVFRWTTDAGQRERAAVYEVVLDDVTLRNADIRDILVAQELLDGGNVPLTEMSETITYTASIHGSVTMESFDDGDGETDRLIFTETSLSDATFRNDDNNLIIETLDGDTVTLVNHFNGHYIHRDMEEIVFAGDSTPVPMTTQTAKARDDQIPTGYVELSEQGEGLDYDAATMGDLEVRFPNSNYQAGHRIETATPLSQVTLRFREDFLDMTFPDNDVLSVQWRDNTHTRPGDFRIGGTTYSLSQIANEAMTDAQTAVHSDPSSRVYFAPGFDDTFTYDPSLMPDGVVVAGYDNTSGDDTLRILADRADVTLTDAWPDLEITTVSDGDTLTIDWGMSTLDSRGFQTYQFDDQTLTNSQVISQATP